MQQESAHLFWGIHVWCMSACISICSFAAVSLNPKLWCSKPAAPVVVCCVQMVDSLCIRASLSSVWPYTLCVCSICFTAYDKTILSFLSWAHVRSCVVLYARQICVITAVCCPSWHNCLFRCLYCNVLFDVCKLVPICTCILCSGPLTESHSMHSRLSRLVQHCSKHGRVFAGKHDCVRHHAT